MTRTTDGYKQLVHALETELGGDPVFGLVGDGNMHAMSHLDHRGASPFVSVNHEAAAVAAADGFATATGRVGVATTTCGPGLTQVGTSLVAAARNGSPVVLLAGDTGRGEEDHVQRFDQVRFARACEADVVDVRDGAVLQDLVHRAFHRARTAQRPVMINVPLDIQLAQCEVTKQEYLPASSVTAAAGAPTPDELADVVTAIEAADRPIILTGRGARRSTSATSVLALAEQLGALVATTLPALGWLDADPYSLGLCGGFGSTISQECFREADLVLAIGSSLDPYTTQHGSLLPQATVVHVDPRQPVLPPDAARQMWIRADAGAFVDALQAELPRAHAGRPRQRTASMQARLQAAMRWSGQQVVTQTAADPRYAMAEVGRHIPTRSTIVSGTGHFWPFVLQYLAPPLGVQYLGGYHFGPIGQTLGFAIGVAAATGERVVAFDGDGGAIMNIQELETAVRHRLPLLWIILNDGVFGAETQRMAVWGIPDDVARFERPSFAALARAMGAVGEEVRSVDEIGQAMARALESAGPAVIDLHVTDEVMNEAFRQFAGAAPGPTPLVRFRP